MAGRALRHVHERGEYEIDNSVGNVAFEKLLALQPDLPVNS